MSPRRRAIGLLELLENPLQIVFHQARAGIRDTHADHSLRTLVAQCDIKKNAADLCELDGVADDIEQNLTQSPRIRHHARRNLRCNMAPKSNMLCVSARCEQLDNILDQFTDIDNLGLKLEASDLDFRVVQKVFDQCQQSGGGRRYCPYISLLLRRQPGICQQSGHAHDTVHRRSDFMADRRQKL